MSSHVVYLESYIEGTSALPAELQRILSNIKALDERVLDLSAQIQQGVGMLLAMPPQYLQSSGPSPEYTELSNRVQADQKMLLQFAEEKVQLAKTAHDLLEVHALELERVMDDLDKELKKSNPDSQLDWEAAAVADFGLETQRGKTPRPLLEDWNSLPAEPPPPPVQVAPVPPPPKRVTQTTASQKSQKRPREEPEAPTPSAPAPPTTTQQQLKKKASTMFNPPLTTQPSYDDLSNIGAYAEEGAPVAEPGRVKFSKQPPAGYEPSASHPQPGGRLLVAADISQTLVGRHAQLFWPDDNLWYLIEIQEVNMVDKTGRVLYWSGEFEDLNLEETARDRQLMLIDEQDA